LIKIIIKEENFKWHLEAFASELFIYRLGELILMFKKNTIKKNSESENFMSGGPSKFPFYVQQMDEGHTGLGKKKMSISKSFIFK